MGSVRYTDLAASGELARRAAQATEILSRCELCPHACGVDRAAGETGACGAGRLARISGVGPHFGEERPLVGQGGSGTIFFAHCSLGCVFCQNYDISQHASGRDATARELADGMLALQRQGCENINLVTPTHFVPQILGALVIAARDGLTLPLVYNCGGYEALSTLRLLRGVVDVYMPDAKYDDPEVARRLSGVEDYPAVMYSALTEMHEQVGVLAVGERGVATRGLLVRHLVLPDGLAGTAQVARFIAERLSPDTYVNVMAQYRPAHRAASFPEVARRTSPGEHAEAVQIARAAGLRRIES